MPLRRAQINSVKNSYMESIRSDANALCQNEFIAITDRRVKSGKAQSLARIMRWTNEKNLQLKRERLRDLLSTEAILYQHELINDYKVRAEENVKSRENRLLGLKSERERQRLKFVEEMRVQQLMSSCDEIQPYLIQKLQDRYKNCQQQQIVDNNLKKMEEIDRDRLWDEVHKQVFNEMTHRECEEFVVNRNRYLNDQKILRKQMLEKNEIPEEDEYEADTMHCGKVFGSEPSEHEIFIQNKRKQIQFAQDLLAQQAENNRVKKTFRESEILHDLADIEKAKNEIKIAEQNAREEKKQKMKETHQFLGYTKNVQEDKINIERERDVCIEKVQREKANDNLNNRNYFIQQRNQFNKSIYEERWKQIVDRRRQMLQEKNEKNDEIIEANKIFAHNVCVEKELLRKKKICRLQYGQELMSQCNYKKAEKEKATNSSNVLLEVIAKEEVLKTELIKNNLGRMYNER